MTVEKTGISKALRVLLCVLTLLALVFGPLSVTSVNEAHAMQDGCAIACVEAAAADNIIPFVDEYETIMCLDGEGERRLVAVRSDRYSTYELVKLLESCVGVVFAEPDYELSISGDDSPALQAATSDLALQRQSDVDYTNLQYAFNGEFGISVPQWNECDGGNPNPKYSAEGKIVAVIDTGVDYTHEDLKDAMWDEGENYPTLVAMGGGKYGYNASPGKSNGQPYDSTDPMDDSGHGTHCAGIIGALWNHRGVSGAASGVKIMAVKVMSDAGVMTTSDALRSYNYVIEAQKAGVDIAAISNSWDIETHSKALELAITQAGKYGAISVFAAGNEHRDIDTFNTAADPLVSNPYVVVVGNTDKRGKQHESSNTGRRSVDVFAPGTKIMSTIPMGTGVGDPLAPTTVIDGVRYECDYENAPDDSKTDPSPFEFTCSEGASLEIASEGAGGSGKCLRIKGDPTSGQASIVSKSLRSFGNSRGMCMEVKVPNARRIDVIVVFTSDDESHEQHCELEGDGNSWQAASVAIPADFNLDNASITITVSADEEDPLPQAPYIDDVKLVDAGISYGYDTGTSMAAPCVAGGAAILAVAFPEDDAATRVARIVGSVKRADDLANLCVSGGIFNLEKALDQNTNPVPDTADTSDGALTIGGRFFGDGAGEIAIDNKAYPVQQWSDESVSVTLPADFEVGEHLVSVTSSDGREGHRYLRIDTPSSLYQRLPLPGRTVAGNPGTYAVTSADFDGDFYASEPRALVGLGGDLYYLLESPDETRTIIYCYDVDKQSWEKVYEGGQAVMGGACTWDGKVLFLAANRMENKSYLGLYDPLTGEASYHLYNDEFYEQCGTIVNTGKGVLLFGGVKHQWSSSKDLSVDVLRTVEPTTMTVTQVRLPDDLTLSDKNYLGIYDANGNGYALNGESITDKAFCFTFSDDGVITKPVMNESLYGDALAQEQPAIAVGGPTKSGVIASGPVRIDEQNKVTADTWTMEWSGLTFTTTDKLASLTKIYNPQGTTYQGHFYVIGYTYSEKGSWVFASAPVETLPQPGDTDPGEPTPAPTPGATTTNAAAKTLSESTNAAAKTLSESTNAAAKTLSESTNAAAKTMPSTGDSLVPAFEIVALVMAMAGACALFGQAYMRRGE